MGSQADLRRARLKLSIICDIPTQERVRGTAKSLIDYALYILNEVWVMEAGDVSICVNPLQVTRAWAALRELSIGRTEKDLSEFIHQQIGMFLPNQDLADVIRGYQTDINEDIPHVVSIFYEHQSAVPFRKDVVEAVNTKFRNTDGFPVFRTISFVSDHSGFSTAHKINREVAFGTMDTVACVVPAEHTPTSLTQILLTSAIDCTFYLKAPNPTKKICFFYSRYDKHIKTQAAIQCISTQGAFQTVTTDHGQWLRLDSWYDDFKLLVLKPSVPVVETLGLLTPDEIIQAIESLSKDPPKPMTVCLPMVDSCRTLRLGNASNHKSAHYSCARIFDREKSELTKALYKAHSDYADYALYVRLGEHHHAARFKIDLTPPPLLSARRTAREEAFNKAPVIPDDEGPELSKQLAASQKTRAAGGKSGKIHNRNRSDQRFGAIARMGAGASPPRNRAPPMPVVATQTMAKPPVPGQLPNTQIPPHAPQTLACGPVGPTMMTKGPPRPMGPITDAPTAYLPAATVPPAKAPTAQHNLPHGLQAPKAPAQHKFPHGPPAQKAFPAPMAPHELLAGRADARGDAPVPVAAKPSTADLKGKIDIAVMSKCEDGPGRNRKYQLHFNHRPVVQVEKKEGAEEMKGDLVFDTPFIYVVTRECAKVAFPFSLGVFTNAESLVFSSALTPVSAMTSPTPGTSPA